MSSKTFRVATQTERIEFTLEYLQDGKPVSKLFHCRPTVPVGLILQFATVSSKDADGAKAMDMIEKLYEAAIVADEYPEFVKLLNDPVASIDIETYSEIGGWLAGEYTARPTGENSDSSQPDPSSGTGLTGGASVTPLTYSRPEPAEAMR